MSLGANIARLRKSNGISRRDFAERIGIPYATISSYETDQRMPCFDRLKKIADFFEIDVNDLMEQSGIPSCFYLAQAFKDNWKRKGPLDCISVNTKEEAALIFAYRKATPEDKQIFDIISNKYVPAREKKSKKAPVSYAPPEPAISIGDLARYYAAKEQLQHSLGREPIISELVAETGLSQKIVATIAKEKETPSEAMLQWYRRLEGLNATPDSYSPNDKK